MSSSARKTRSRAETTKNASDEKRDASPPLPLEETQDGTGAREFERFVRDALKDLLKGQCDLKTKVESFEASVNNSLEHIFERVEKLETKNETLETKTKQQESVVEQLVEKCNTLERFSRRNNFRIVGVPVSRGENCIYVVSEILKNDFNLESATIERAHRDGKGFRGKPPHILTKMLSYRDKVAVMIKAKNALREKDYYVVDDLTKDDLREKKKWKTEVAAAYSRGEKCRFFAGKWRGGDGVPIKFSDKT
ncbi:hypothetical protein Bbelb_108460 [Branchiostoma belcheri]|nr:hypothetical protein Bbelb_108460 [Branchiostoma belcheri]